MRTRKLLAAAALLTSAFDSSCKKESASLPGNPKGSFYADDAGGGAPLPGNPKGSFYDDAAVTTAPLPVPAVADAQAPIADAGAKHAASKPDAGPARPHGLPGNPKGSRYDDDMSK